MARGFRPLLALLLLPLGSCGDATPGGEAPGVEPAVIFDSARVLLVTGRDTVPLAVEVAATAEQWTMGLMDRDALAEHAGMLFVSGAPRTADQAFWMFRTRIPLDVAFLDEAGTIVAIRSMEPCASPEPRWCPSYAPGVPYRDALEVNRGYFARAGIEVGDRVVLP
jgi:uncharacterized membrane protein (UPF0127 family)